MTQFASTSSGDDEILVQIMLERDQAGSRALDPEVYVKRYPHREGEMRELFQVQKALDTSRPYADISQPERLGEFRILRKVAQGGMGEIYEAVQEPLQRRVAVKVIRQGRISPSARERFLREQKVLAQLHQTHIVPIHTAGEEGPLQYFAMPFIDGAALSHVVRAAFQFETSQPGSKTPPLGKLAAMLVAESKERAKTTTSAASNKRAVEAQAAKRATKALSSSEASAGKTARLVLSLEYFRSVAQVMADAAEALHYAHRANVLHRDIKPSNIMVDKDEQCWLIDFGLAGYLKEENKSGAEVEGDQVRQEPTTISGAMGTYQYMAPEQFGGKADARADVWGLGATLYELLTLRRAFDGDSDKEIRDKVLSAEPSGLKELVANLPADPAAI